MTTRYINGVLSTVDITTSTDVNNITVSTGTLKTDGTSLSIYDNDISGYLPLSGNTPDITYGATATEAQATANRIAINALLAEGGDVHLGAGVIMVTGTGSASDGAILLKDGSNLIGQGMGVTIIRAYDSGNNKVTGVVRTESGIENSYIGVYDLTIDGNKANQTGTGDITVYYAGVTPASSDNDTDIRCVRVEAINGYNGSDNAGYGFDPHEVVNRLVMIDCIAHDNQQDGFTIDGCINFSIVGCRSYSNGRHGFNPITGSKNGCLTNCVAYSNTDNGFVVQENALEIVISGCVSHTNAKEGMLIRAGSSVTETSITITGCLVQSNGRDGITIRGASGNHITSNTFKNNATAGGTRYDCNIETDGTNVATRNFVSGNIATALSTPKTDYAFFEDAGTNPPNKNVFIGNHAEGQTSGAIDINGANTFADDFAYTVATVPTASDWTSKQIYVSNGAAGSAILAFSNGTNWLRSDTGAAISAS